MGPGELLCVWWDGAAGTAFCRRLARELCAEGLLKTGGPVDGQEGVSIHDGPAGDKSIQDALDAELRWLVANTPWTRWPDA
jgi:hypothetical protein